MWKGKNKTKNSPRFQARERERESHILTKSLKFLRFKYYIKEKKITQSWEKNLKNFDTVFRSLWEKYLERNVFCLENTLLQVRPSNASQHSIRPAVDDFMANILYIAIRKYSWFLPTRILLLSPYYYYHPDPKETITFTGFIQKKTKTHVNLFFLSVFFPSIFNPHPCYFSLYLPKCAYVLTYTHHISEINLLMN